MEKPQVLLVEDSPDDADLIRKTIEKHLPGRFQVTHKATMAEAMSYLKENKDEIGIVLLDLGLPDTRSCKDSFDRMKAFAAEIPVVILTGLEDHKLAVSLVRGGAEDFVNKGLLQEKPEQLRDVMEFAACRHELLGDTHKKHAEKLKDKDEIISWMGGGYSVKP